MTDLSTINELLEANEDEHTQFKEAKTILISVKWQNAVVPCQMVVVEDWYSKSQIKDFAKLWAVRHFYSQRGLEKA